MCCGRLKTDPAIIDDLPDKIEMKQYCQLTTEQASLYQSVVDDMMDKIESSDGIQRRGNVLAAMAKLKQVCNHPALLLHDRSAIGRRSGKVIRLEEILEEILAEGDKVLCFTQFTEFAEMLLPHLSARFGTDIAYLHGGTPRPRRDELVTRFAVRRRPAGLPAVAQGRRHRAEPDRRQPRDPPRPVVEPGRGEPGHRPCVPDRPDAERAGAEVHLHRARWKRRSTK